MLAGGVRVSNDMKFDWNDLLFYEHKMVQGTVIS